MGKFIDEYLNTREKDIKQLYELKINGFNTLKNELSKLDKNPEILFTEFFKEDIYKQFIDLIDISFLDKLFNKYAKKIDVFKNYDIIFEFSYTNYFTLTYYFKNNISRNLINVDLSNKTIFNSILQSINIANNNIDDICNNYKINLEKNKKLEHSKKHSIFNKKIEENNIYIKNLEKEYKDTLNFEQQVKNLNEKVYPVAEEIINFLNKLGYKTLN